MAEVVRAVLVVEIGSITTRVSLIDQVDGESRLIGQAETLTSRELPYQNIFFAVQEATAQLTDLTGRQLLRDGRLLIPQTSAGDGIDAVVVVTSALEPLRVVVAAIASDVSARSALRAVRGVPSVTLAVLTLDDTLGQPPVTSDQSWLERQLETLLPLLPDVMVVTGGIEGGAVEAISRLAHLINLKLLLNEVIDEPLPTIIYAGNSAAQAQVQVALSERRCELLTVANVRPALEREVLSPLRQALLARYARQLADLPGLNHFDQAQLTLRTVVEAQYTITRFLAERRQQPVLCVDVGATTTTLMAAAPNEIHAAIHGVRGTAYGAAHLLSEVGPTAIARWLPFAIDESELVERLLNRVLRPQTMPATREECYLDLALAREALALGVANLRDETPALEYSRLLASGGPFIHAPHPGMALLALLDGLQPGNDLPGLLLHVHLDTLSLLAVCGALAAVSAEAALSVFDHDFLANTPLATCIVLQGGSRMGEPVAEVELITVGGGSETIQVHHGEIARLPLAPGRYAQVKVKPASGVRVGRDAPGEPVESDPAEVPGSLLGLIIDARGRPLVLPDNGAERRRLMWSWLRALGAERSDSPYPEPEVVLPPPPPETNLTPPVAPKPRQGWFGRRRAPAPTPPADQPPATPKPRQGWFGRRKAP
ncbi:glutamate mutase L [Chloroflexus sp.]|uniref:glutamate mutase L n=1 Tax=Chloroflexus sp. TaxID=1904827 RepID=UPI002ACD6A9D|nr:glutamate mutase L [Chloroflexus sp.]